MAHALTLRSRGVNGSLVPQPRTVEEFDMVKEFTGSNRYPPLTPQGVKGLITQLEEDLARVMASGADDALKTRIQGQILQLNAQLLAGLDDGTTNLEPLTVPCTAG